MSDETLIDRVRRALGRSAPPASAPVPPAIDESVVRLVAPHADLLERFLRAARDNRMLVESGGADEMLSRMADLLRARGARSVALAGGEVLDRVGVAARLAREGFVVRRWSEMTLDELYDVDAAVTDVDAAVAETGSLVIRPGADNGRALSLVPPLHVAVVPRSRIIADLFDLFSQPPAATTVLITGPSKTADIEMNLVTGVHGPGCVQVLVIDD